MQCSAVIGCRAMCRFDFRVRVVPAGPWRADPFALVLLLLAVVAPALQAAPSLHDRPASTVEDPGTEYWRYIRQRPAEIEALKRKGEIGRTTTQVEGIDSTVLVNAKGETWRLYRSDRLVPVSMGILGGVLLLLVILYLLFGRTSRGQPDSGKRLFRFGDYERTLHWFMAALFIFLGITGLILLYGRPLIMPLIGKEGFSALASASKEGHNLMGPVFLVAILLFLARFWRRNLYQKGDLTWLFQGGGFIGSAHPRAGFFNMGEKVLFWLVVLVGLALSFAGLVLLFPNFGQGRVVMEGAHLVHTLGAVLLLAVILGHIYMAIAVKGTLEGMTRGYVELNWAHAHHSEWARQMEEQGEVIEESAVAEQQGTATASRVESA